MKMLFRRELEHAGKAEHFALGTVPLPKSNHGILELANRAGQSKTTRGRTPPPRSGETETPRLAFRGSERR
jgi:hypothetical protein